MSKKFAPVDPDTATHDELKRSYRKLIDSRNGLKAHNASLTDWCNRISRAITHLSTEGSLVFQAMAEKAGVRGHPSVTAAVQMFDSIAHPQWQKEPPPSIEWPTKWDFDGDDNWSGDADMALNAPLAEAIEILEHLKFEVKPAHWERISQAMTLIQHALENSVDGVKEANGLKPRPSISIDIPASATVAELREAIFAISFAALDLAQDMEFANHMLRRDLRAAVYRRVAADLYRLAWIDVPQPNPAFDIKVLGANETPF